MGVSRIGGPDLRALVFGLASLLAAGHAANADAIISPGALGSVEGNSNNSLPLDEGFGPARTQQVYAASEFASWDAPRYINQIAFRQDLNGNPFAATLADVRIALSTTPRAVDGLSTNFADNLGADESVAYRGDLPLYSVAVGDRPGGAPRDFEVAINLQTPFLYDPSKGNLLVDMTIPTPLKTSILDAAETPGDGTSRVYAYGSDLSSGTADSIGLITRFQTGGPDGLPQPPIPDGMPQSPPPTVVPEPGSIAILGLGALVLLARRRK